MIIRHYLKLFIGNFLFNCEIYTRVSARVRAIAAATAKIVLPRWIDPVEWWQAAIVMDC